MAAQSRQMGTLKAVGVTPGQVTLMLLAEYLVVAGLATVVGVVAGTLLSPVLAGSLRFLYGAPQAPPITWPRTAAVAAVAAAVVVLATVRPALRGARHSTLRSLVTNVRAPRRPSVLARLAGALRLPLPAVLGVRTAGRRAGRTLANAAGLALCLAMVTVRLTLNGKTRDLHIIAAEDEAYPGEAAEVIEVFDLLRLILSIGTGLLLTLALVNAVITAVFAARDSPQPRDHACGRRHPRPDRDRVRRSPAWGVCLLACMVGIPFGVALFNTLGGDLAPAHLSPLTYLALAAATPLLYGLIVAVPARLLATQPVTPQLQYE